MAHTRTRLEPRSPKGGRPTREVAERLSEHILESALAALSEHGPAGVTMEVVAERASVSKKTLYSRFRSKEELTAAVIIHTLERHVWKGDGEGTGSAAERLFALLTALLKNSAKPEVVAVEQLFVDHKNEDLQNYVRATREVPVRMIIDLLMEAKRAGEADFSDPRVIAFILLDTMVLGPRTRFLMLTAAEREVLALDVVSREIFDVVWRGLSPRPGGAWS